MALGIVELVWALLGALGLFLASTAVLLLVILVVAGVVEFVGAWRRAGRT